MKMKVRLPEMGKIHQSRSKKKKSPEKRGKSSTRRRHLLRPDPQLGGEEQRKGRGEKVGQRGGGGIKFKPRSEAETRPGGKEKGGIASVVLGSGQIN